MGSEKEEEDQVAADQHGNGPGEEIAEVEGIAGAAAALDEEGRIGGVVVVEAEAPEGITVLLDRRRRELAEAGPAVGLAAVNENFFGACDFVQARGVGRRSYILSQ